MVYTVALPAAAEVNAVWRYTTQAKPFQMYLTQRQRPTAIPPALTQSLSSSKLLNLGKLAFLGGITGHVSISTCQAAF